MTIQDGVKGTLGDQPGAEGHRLDKQLQRVLKQLERQRDILDRFGERLAAIEHAIGHRRAHTLEEGVRRDIATTYLGTGLIGRINTLLRLHYLDRLTLSGPERFVARRAKFLSNDEDDGITLSILAEVGVETRRFVEIGCGTNGGNSGFLALECGWRGLMLDASEERIDVVRQVFRHADVTVHHAFLTRENVNGVLEEHGFRGDIDLLSIDIDGNDFWIWDALTAVSARLAIVEYNSYFGPERSVVIPYEPDFFRRNYKGYFYGASIQAVTRLAAQKGYRLIATEPRGHNAYFLRNDVAPGIPAIDPARAWRLLDDYERRDFEGKPDVYEYARTMGITLVEIPAGSGR